MREVMGWLQYIRFGYLDIASIEWGGGVILFARGTEQRIERGGTGEFKLELDLGKG